MFSIYEITAAPHFPHALLPLIAASVKPETVVSLRLSLEKSAAADIEITERDGEICVAVSAGVTGS
jgi:hypothetical protein